MSKKLCSILLAFAMIMLTITNDFAAVQFENVEGSTFKIENLKELGFISGYGDGSLRLDQYIKRSEFAKVLVNAFDKEQEAEAIKGKFKPFKDVDESHWANGIISIVKNLKGVNNTQIINGYPDGTFRPEEHITNAEALKMLVCCVKGDLTEEMYKNAEWFESWVKWAIELGIIGADSDVPNIVDMNAKVTRGNVFTMFYNAFEEDEVERPIEKTEEKEPEKKTEDKKEEKSASPDRHAGSRHDRYDRYPEYPYYPDLPIVPFKPPVPEVKTYSISIDSSANGIVSADKYSAEEGEIVNLRIIPNKGYKLDTLEVTDVFGNKVQLVNQWFVMPSSNVVVSAKFVEETVEPVEFDKENIKHIEIKSEPSKMNYVEGERLDLSGFIVNLTDINDNTVEVTYNDFLEYGIDVEPVDGTELTSEDNGKQITVSKSGIEAKTNQIEVTVLPYNDDLFASLEIISEPENLTYNEGDSLKLNGLKVKLTDKNDKSKVVELKDFAANGITTVPSNEATLSLADNGNAITVKKGEKTATTTGKLEITELTYDDTKFASLEIINEPANLKYKENDKLDLTGLKVKLTDKNGKTKQVELEDFATNGITTEPTNEATLSLENNGKAISVTKSSKTVETTKKLEITELQYNDDLFESLEIISEPTNLSYKENDKLDLTGLKVKLTDTNGKTKEVELQDFATNGITTEPADEVELTTLNNGQAIKVTKGNKTVETNPLTVSELQYNDDLFASLEIITEPENLSYTEKEKLDLTGLKVKLTDSNGKSKEVELKDFKANGITTEPANEATLSLQDNGKAISVTKGEVTATTKGTLEITELTYDDTKFESLDIIAEPVNLSYKEKDKLDLTGLKVRLTDSNGKTKEVALKDFAANGITTEPTDGATLSLENNGKAISVIKSSKTVETTKKLEITELEYNDKLFASLEIINEPANLSYKEKDKLNLTGLKVKLTDRNGKIKEVELKDFATNGITTEPANGVELNLDNNNKAITVKKGEKTATTTNTIEIIVFNPNKIVNIKVKNQPNKMVYDEGMALDLDGMVITLTDENGLTKDVEFARGAGTEYSKYIKTSIEDRNILGEEHNEKFIIVSLNQNPNIKTQTEILIVKHYFTIKYRGIWIAGFMNIPDDGLQEKVEEGSLWEYPSNEGKKITLDRTGFEFIGWQTEDGREIKTPFRPSKDMVMVAKWRDKNQPIMEYLKEQFETAAKLSTSIVKDKNKESLGLEYNEKVITIVPAKMEAFNIAEYNLINELQKLVKENFLTGYTINSKIRELNSSLTENQMLEYLIRDFASIANVNVSGLDYSNKSQVSDKVKEILTTLANSEKTVEITVNLAKDDVNTIDVYKFVFLKYKDMSASEVESTNNFYNDLMKNTVNSVNQQGIWENDPNNPDASVKVPVFKTEYDGNENVYTININTRYTDLLAKQTGGTGFKTAVVNFLTGGHVGKNGKVQNNLQKVKITQIGTEKSVIVDREQLNEIVHVNLGNMKSLLAPFSYIFMPEGKDVNTLSLQDLVGQEATFEYTYVNENYETYTVVRTVKFDTFTE